MVLRKILNRIKSNWGFKERENLNENWSIIEDGFTNVNRDIRNTKQQINNIIAQSGTSDTEVVAARMDLETGENFVTIGQRLDAQHKKLTTHLDDIKKRLTASQSASQSIASASDTTIIFDTSHENDANYFTLHTNGTVTVNADCTLAVRVTVAILANGLNGYVILKALKNNQYILPSAQIDSLSNYSKSLLSVFEIDCVAGDNLAVQIYQYNDASTPISTDTSNWFTKLQLGVKA